MQELRRLVEAGQRIAALRVGNTSNAATQHITPEQPGAESFVDATSAHLSIIQHTPLGRTDNGCSRPSNVYPQQLRDLRTDISSEAAPCVQSQDAQLMHQASVTASLHDENSEHLRALGAHINKESASIHGGLSSKSHPASDTASKAAAVDEDQQGPTAKLVVENSNVSSVASSKVSKVSTSAGPPLTVQEAAMLAYREEQRKIRQVSAVFFGFFFQIPHSNCPNC